MSCGHKCNCSTWGDHARSVSFAPSSMPTRGNNINAIQVEKTEKGWEKDMPAYLRLRKNGTQPPHIDGSAKLEATATDPLEVSAGKTFGEKLPLIKEVNQALGEFKPKAKSS